MYTHPDNTSYANLPVTSGTSLTLHSLPKDGEWLGAYYYLLDEEGSKYKIAVKTNEELVPFIKIDDIYNIWYREKKNLTEIMKITK